MKIVFTFLALLVVLLPLKTQVLFDPASYPADSLPANMTIIEVNNRKFLKIAVDGFYNQLNIKPSNIATSSYITTDLSFIAGSNSDKMSRLNMVIQLSDTTKKPFTKTAEISTISTTDTVSDITPIRYTNRLIQQLNFTIRDTVSWDAISGDTLLVGKIEALPQTNIVFDPAKADTLKLPNNIKIVHKYGDTLLQVKLNGWNNYLDIPTVYLDSLNTYTFNAYFDKGETSYTADSVLAFIGLENNAKQVQVLSFDIPDSEDPLIEYPTNYQHLFKRLQIAVQRNYEDWAAINGAYFYIGKITAQNLLVPCSQRLPLALDFSYIPYNSDTTILDGSKDDVYRYPTRIDNLAFGEIASTLDGTGVRVAENTYNYARWYSSYNNEYLSLYVDVTDDFIQQEASNPVNERAGDALEVFLAMYRGIYFESSSNSTHFTIPAGSQGETTSNILYNSQLTETGYTVEIKVPLDVFSFTSASTKSTSSCMADEPESIGFYIDFNCIDFDEPGELESILCWGNSTGFDILNNSTLNYRGKAAVTGMPTSDIITNMQHPEFSVYPNPADKHITVSSTTAINQLQVFNSSGQLVINHVEHGVQFVDLNTTFLSPGLYLLKIVTADGTIATYKFIKQ